MDGLRAMLEQVQEARAIAYAKGEYDAPLYATLRSLEAVAEYFGLPEPDKLPAVQPKGQNA